jgi:circadian clock protein KaiC
MKRFPSTVAGLDDILHGGLFEGGVYILEGPPGVGKTTLANQIAYNRASDGQKTLYVTMLSESHARMVQHMSHQTFFRKSAVNAFVFYLSGYRELENEGLKGVLGLLRGELARSGATLLVVDGLVVSSPGIDEGVRQFVHELQSLVSAMGCTCLVLTTGRGNALSAEQTMVDGIFAFEDRLFRGKAERVVQVKKFRGSEVVRGQHSFCITNQGLQFFPRLESLPLQPKDRRTGDRVALGLRDLDEALGDEGVRAGSMSLAVGETGSGKTLLAYRFAAAASDAAPGLLLLGSAEVEFGALDLAARFGIGLQAAVERGTLRIEPIGLVDESLDEMGHKILRLVDDLGVRRLILDGAAALADTLAFQDRGYRFFGRLLHELRRRGVTALFTLDPTEIAVASGTPLAVGVAALFDNVFALETAPGAQVTRQLTIRKMRGASAGTAVFALRD